MKYNINKIIKTILVILGFWYSAYLQYVPVILFNLNPSKLTNSDKALLSLFSSIVFAIILIIIYFDDLKKEFKKYKDNLGNDIDVGIKYWMIGMIIMMTSNALINLIFKTGGAENEKIVQTMLKSSPLVMLISAGVIAPFTEEIVFRKSLKDIFSNKWLFAFMSFLLFGGAHVIGNEITFANLLYIIPYGAFGFTFALAYYETDTIYTSMVMHIAHNMFLLITSIIL